MLVPGVQFGDRTGRGDGLGGFPIPGQGFSVSANGQREIHQVVSLDGVDAKDPRIHITNFVPSIEAIEEFKIQTNAFTAEYGFGGGANVQHHHEERHQRSARHVVRIPAQRQVRRRELLSELRARPPSLPRLKKDALRRNQFGLVVSGPVLIPKLYNGKNKTFWAFNYRSPGATARARCRRQRGRLDRIPTGRFLRARGHRLHRTRRRQCYARRIRYLRSADTGHPFANNIIPAIPAAPGRFERAGPLRAKSPIRPGRRHGLHRHRRRPPADEREYVLCARRSQFQRQRSGLRASCAGTVQTGHANNINPNLPVFVDSKVTQPGVASGSTPSIRSRSTSSAFGFNTSDDLTSNPRTDNTSFDMDSLGVGQIRVFGDSNRKLTAREHGIPQFTGLPFTLQELTNGNGYDNMDTIQIGNHLSMVRGKHNLKIGCRTLPHLHGARRGEPGRGPVRLQQATRAVMRFASFLLGLPNTTQSAEGLPLTFPRAKRFGAYIQRRLEGNSAD